MTPRTNLAMLITATLAALATSLVTAAPPPNNASPEPPARTRPQHETTTQAIAYLALQTRYTSDPVHLVGVSNSAVCLNGQYFRSSNKLTVEQFLNSTEQDVRESLTRFFAGHPHVGRMTRDIVIIDIELPIGIMKMGDYLNDPRMFARIVEAFRMRYRVTRQMMPDAKLAQYGFCPDPRGDADSPKFLRGLAGVKEAARLGMFDDLDYICPTLYLRYGATDTNYQTIGNYTRLGLEAFGGLKRTTGTEVDLFPLLSLRVFNGRSKHRRQLAIDFDPTLEHSLRLQVDIIRKSGICQFGFWSAREHLNDHANPRQVTMMKVLATALGRPVPPRRTTIKPSPPR